METRAERSARRRAELLNQLDEKFREFCLQVDKALSATDRFRWAIKQLDLYIQGLVKAKPQEKSFILSVAMEWQRVKIAQMEDIKNKRNSNAGEMGK